MNILYTVLALASLSSPQASEAQASEPQAPSYQAEARLAMNAVRDICLAAKPGFADAAQLAKKAGLSEISHKSYLSFEDKSHIWSSGEGRFIMIFGDVRLSSIDTPHRTCAVTTGVVPGKDILNAAIAAFGMPEVTETTGLLVRWPLSNSPGREMQLSQDLAGVGNIGIAVIEYDEEGS